MDGVREGAPGQASEARSEPQASGVDNNRSNRRNVPGQASGVDRGLTQRPQSGSAGSGI